MDGCVLRKVPLWAACFVGLWTLVAVAGCVPPDSKTDASSDIELIRGRASEVGGAATEPERWNRIFAEGAAPADSEKPRYANNMYFVPRNSVDIDGESATATVQVEDVNGKPIGEAEWTFQKSPEGKWKIKTAPMPGGA